MKQIVTAALSLSLLCAAALPGLASGAQSPAPAPEPALAAPAPEPALAAPGLAIEIDGEELAARACVMLPLRAAAEALGCTVTWDSGTITVEGGGRYVRMTIGEDRYFAAPAQEGMMGASLFSLGCAPFVSGDTTYVPLELFDALLGCREGAVTLDGDTVRIAAQPGSVQIPSPFTDHATLADAAQAAGFPMTAPETVDGSPRRAIQTMDGGPIQVSYGDGDGEVCIRKAPGGGDISGDWTDYPHTETMDLGGTQVVMKGAGGLVHLATWTSGGYTYSILARAGLSRAGMTALVRTVR